MTDEQTDLDAIKRYLKEWRHSHPNATFLEMERAVEEHVSKMRASLLQELANDRGEEVKLCPQCGRRMWRRGVQPRAGDPGGLLITLSRHYHPCPS